MRGCNFLPPKPLNAYDSVQLTKWPWLKDTAPRNSRCPRYISMDTSWTVAFRVLLGVSLFAIALPFAVVALEQAVGVLDSQQDWIAQGNEFGPWRGKWEGFTLFFPILVMSPIAAIASILFAVRDYRWRPIPGGLGLFSLHVAALLFQQLTLVWLIE